MAGESILVVDDAVFTLKLIATVLRNDGFKVQLASTAEQGLLILGTLLPDLVLVDIRLPGMNGLDMTRRIRRQTRFESVAVVAMTSRLEDSVEQDALDAGCNGFVAKPVEPKALGAQIRRFLGVEREKSPFSEELPFTTGRFSLSGAESEGLRRGFLEEAVHQNRGLLSALDARFDADAARKLVYRWIGAAGLLGYGAISEGALALETLLAATPLPEARVREALADMMFVLLETSAAANTPLPDAMIRELALVRVALIGFADAEADRICGAFDRVGSRPLLLQSDVSPDSMNIMDCDIVMVHVRPETLTSPWLAREARRLPKPLVLMGAREQLLSLDPSVMGRAREFLIDVWQSEEVLMRLCFALRAPAGADADPVMRGGENLPATVVAAGPGFSSRVEPKGLERSRPKVLIVDDDESTRTLVQRTVSDHGMDCLLASTGMEALRMVVEHRPQAVILDINIPGMEGFEVLAEIRRQKIPARVVMLTGRHQEQDILRCFGLGADDYVRKPFNPIELTMRIKVLL